MLPWEQSPQAKSLRAAERRRKIEAGETVEEEEDSDSDGDGDEPVEDEKKSCALTIAGKMPLAGQKYLPEDLLKRKLDERLAVFYTAYETAILAPNGRPYPVDNPAFTDWKTVRSEAVKFAKERLMKADADLKRVGEGKFDFLAKASYEEKELFAKISVAESQKLAHERVKEARKRVPIGADIGTGAPSPHAYVEIRPRPGPEEAGPKKQAVNSVVSKALGIPLSKASRLVELGSVWAWDDVHSKAWERIKRDMFVEPHTVLRVFPNPERFKTCYVRDWRDRVKKVDSDFVVVDKPPLLPCFAKVSNGREALGQCLREGLHVREWGGYTNPITEELKPCNEIDDECSGLIVLSRHEAAVEAFDSWLLNRQVVFEFVALCTANVEVGLYRHFYKKAKKQAGRSKPDLYDEIPPHMVKHRRNYDNWAIAEMEVVATAPLPGNCAAVRIRTHGTGWKERIRAQLAMLGAPVLNDSVKATAVPSKTGFTAGRGAKLPKGASGKKALMKDSEGASQLAASASVLASQALLGGAVDDDTLRGPYGHKLELLPPSRKAADRGVSQRPRKKTPVALHLARVEFAGRVVTCAPPAYWPEGAAAAVAIKLTAGDIKSNITAFLVTQGGYARFGKVGGQFGVRVEWLEEHFIVDRSVGLVFASEEAKDEWEAGRRAKFGDKAWQQGQSPRKKAKKLKMMRIREKYVSPAEMGFKGPPRYKQIKKNLVKAVNS